MKVFFRLFCTGLLLFHVFTAYGKTVRLITIGPGDAFWSAFGHTAIAIDKDVYGFGYFSFEDDVITEFINNKMLYELGLSEFDREMLLARQQNREFSVIELDLSDDEVAVIESYLSWHNLPANQAYQYDYFLNNCSTKVRDIIESAWQGSLATLGDSLSGSSYFEQTFPAKNQGLMNFGLAIGYGWLAYQDRSFWELMAFPVYFEQQILNLAPDLVITYDVLFQAANKNHLLSLISTHWSLITYVLFWMFLLSMPKLKKGAAKIWFKWHGVLGVLLLILWLMTPHQVADWNFNVLLFSPFGLFSLNRKVVQMAVFLSYLSWFIIAVYLQAWYLMALLLPAVFAWGLFFKQSSFNKSNLTFG